MVSRFDSIRIDGLFGKKDPIIIEFDDHKDPVKILYGVNGSGKTTIMKIIQHSYCWNPIELFKLPFESITYILNRRGDYHEHTTLTQLDIKCNSCSSQGHLSPIKKPGEITLEELLVEKNPPNIFHIENDRIFCHKCGKVVEVAQDLSGDTDQMIRDLISEINAMFNQYESLKTELDQLLIQALQFQASNQVQIKHKKGELDITVNINPKRNNLEQKESKSQQAHVKSAMKNILHSIDKGFRHLPILLFKKYDDLESDPWTTSAAWDDGLSLNYKKGNLILEMKREFDFSTKLTITKLTKRPEQIYFDFSQEWETVDVGNYIQIVEEKEPILEFSNSLVNDLLKLMKKITLMRNPSLKAESLDWGFVGLFDTSTNLISLRMPDIYDYWDSDWDKIETKSADYRITRFGDVSHQRSSVKDWIEIYHAFTNEKIEIHDFLIHHLEPELVTHSKKGTRRRSDSDTAVKDFSPDMKTPELISHLFDYQKFLISPGESRFREGIRNQYYVVLPKILNISTERKNDDDYFNAFSTNYNRIIRTCYKLVNSISSKIQKGSRLAPGYDEERGAITYLMSEIARDLRSSHNINLEEFIDTIMDEVPRAAANHEIQIESILYFLRNEHVDYSEDEILSRELAEVISSIVKFSEVIKLKRYLSKIFDSVDFDLKNSVIYTGPEREFKLKFSDLSSGIRQKFRIITSVAMQVISAEKSLILIDEPEISLHLSWQRSFVDDLLEFLSNLTSKSRLMLDSGDSLENIISIIISTHSPAILSNHYHRGHQVGESDFGDD